MALIHSVTHGTETYPQAYSRITSWRGDGLDVYLYVCTYKDLEARMREDFPILAIEYKTTLQQVQGAFYDNAYAYLKTLPDFVGATDYRDPDEPAA